VSTIGWVIVVILVIPMIGVLVWLVISATLVRIPSGSLGLLMVKGRATDTALLPGPHFVLAIRRRMVEIYPSVEMSYRAGAADSAEDTDLDRTGPALPVTLGDRTTAIITYSVRFRLIPDRLREIHERFGPGGVFGIVRDDTNTALTATLRDSGMAVDNFFGAALDKCQQDLRQAVTDELRHDGIDVTGFLLGTPDLGRTGEVIQATLRARHELELEQAEAATRMARALNDTDLSTRISSSGEAAWRYRETDLWTDLVQRTETLQVALRALNPAEGGAPIQTGSESDQAPPPAKP
jgi:hypothetical protein